MATIYRHGRLTTIQTPFSPLEDLASLIRGLRSEGVTKTLLRSKHGLTSADNVDDSAHQVSQYANYAVSYLEQALNGPPQVSFLPLYYALLNLCKICIIASGLRKKLQANRYHGLKYIRKNSRSLLTERVRFYDGGVIPLYYQALTGDNWNFGGYELQMREVYPYILQVSYEYEQAFNRPCRLRKCEAKFVYNERKGLRAEVELADPAGRLRPKGFQDRRNYRLISGLRKIDEDEDVFATTWHERPFDRAIDDIREEFRPFLLYCSAGGYNVIDEEFEHARTYTPMSNRQLLLPAEIPILLALCHMSFVVRYRPRFLAKLEGSEAWSVLLALRKHGTLEFMRQVWGLLNNNEYILSPVV